MKFTGKTVYISGKITGNPNFKVQFGAGQIQAYDYGARLVLNPAILPSGWDYKDYMEHCMIMVRRADVLLMLPDWKESPGATAEHAYAISLKKEIVYA